MHRVAVMDEESKNEEATAKLQAAIEQVCLTDAICFREAVSRGKSCRLAGWWTSSVRVGCEIQHLCREKLATVVPFWCRCAVGERSGCARAN